MKHAVLLAILFSTFIGSKLKAQDVLSLKNGETLQVKVMEITDAEVKYKKYSNPNGPQYTAKKSDVLSVKYENGEMESFIAKSSDAKETENKSEASAEKKIVLPPVNDGKSIAKVKKLSGIDVYCLSTPLIKYEIIFNAGDLMSDADVKSILLGGLVRADVDEKMTKLINATYRKAQKENKTIDAVVYSGGNRIIAIKYADNEVAAQALSKVEKINDIEVYAFAEPVNSDYTVVNSGKAKSGGFVSMATYGIVSSTIEDDLTKMVGRLNGSKKHKINAILYMSGKTGDGIKFN